MTRELREQRRLDDYAHGDPSAARLLRQHLQQHPEHASGLFRFLLLTCYPRHVWGCLTRTEESYVRVLVDFLTCDEKQTAISLWRRVQEWYHIRCCEHCGIFHGDVGLRFCKPCFAGELLPGDRRHYLHRVKLTTRQRRVAALQ